MSLSRITNNLVLVFFITLSCLVLTACQIQGTEQSDNKDELALTISYRDNTTLPSDAVLSITLEDVSIMDIAAQVISSAKTTISSAQPFKITLPYSADLIKPNLQYNVRAQIHSQDKLLYTSTTLRDPFKESPSATMAIEVDPVNALKLNTPLTNTYWKVISVGKEKPIKDENSQELFLQLRSENRAKGFSGCNSFMGRYEAGQSELKFLQLASTRKMCQKMMPIEDSFLAALNKTAHYQIDGEVLLLVNDQQQPLATLKAVYFN